MNALASRAEILKLAALLRVKSNGLEFLQGVPADHLRRLRQQLDARLQEEETARLRRLVMLAQLPPPPVAALVGRRVFGALLCARLAGQMPPQRALAVAAHLDDGFLADIAVELDPRHAGELFAGLPAERAARIGALLLSRGELAALGRMMEALGGDALGELLDRIPDNSALLRLLYLVGPGEHLAQVMELLTPQRLQQLVLVPAAGAAELWPQALWLLSFADDARRRVLGEVLAGQDDTVLDGLIDAVQSSGLWPALLPLLSAFGEAGQRRFVARPALLAREVIGDLIGAASREGQWGELAGLLRAGGEPLQRGVARALSGVSQAVLIALLKAMVRNNMAESVLPILLRLDPGVLPQLARAAAALPAQMAAQLERQLLVAGAGQALASVRTALLGKS